MIATIINYCTNDYRFLGRCIEEVKLFSSLILVPVCDHFFDGRFENRSLLERSYAEFPEVQFLEFVWDVKQLYTPLLSPPVDEEERICLWHSTSRYIAYHFLREEVEYVLFLDADEIAEGLRFKKWLDQKEYCNFDALWFLSYMYRFSASERRIGHQYAPLLVRKKALEPLLILNAKERFGILQSLTGHLWFKGFEDRPFFHHYSWVRSRKECLHKVKTWGKRTQTNWPLRLQQAWKEGIFLEEGSFERVDPFFDPLAIKIPQKFPDDQYHPNVVRIDRTKLFRQSMEALIDV